ncbi:gamma-glutamyl-gamma-aminobutyrate hydrolase family protein [Sutterella sp.]|uniref:gamma-glutamyl-gamma-aminobutyrate hydrolase family protein n=1 Tax=Sutterella sp. TaxID=1981025 RepID=UPI0026DEA7C1|nr:gamma-glutamyl-gamma-aminobutyrate hydrolase family protein [Sutterella sp.]MDO5532610.1 gamma-glutamyl-gamma-aminobutyrate hydrolase family protein [Sutterella sp.]
MKPLIGVTPDVKPTEYIGVRDQYMHSITLAGGIPVMLPISAPEEDLEEIVSRLDGLLLTGGADIDPALYGAEKSPACGEPRPERDRMEMAILRAAVKVKLPTLGICRGCQVLNVFYGGDLVQDIESELGVPNTVHHQEADYRVVTHDIVVEPGSLLAEIGGTDDIHVNSKHHQCVKTLGKGLRLGGRSKNDGIIESFDDPAHPFMLAVQWHPEMLSAERPEALALFKALVEAAKRCGA